MEIADCLTKVDTDKIWYHCYGDAYKEFFKNFKREDKLNILEIGTQKGGSLLAWKEYFPNSKVTGIDIIDVVPEKYRKDTVTRIISDIKDWKTDQKFDIIIDDGSHYLGDLVFVISQYIPKLNKNGVLVIEDVRHPKFLYSVIENLMEEFGMGHPDYKPEGTILVKHFHTATHGTERSFIMCLQKT